MSQSKQHISKSIKFAIEQKGLSLRKTAEKIDGISYPQLHRITSEKNYNIDTLLKVLDALDLEITITDKRKA